jgi:SpoVK/Ycf46/Vps4 family AAA+-type ATPase
VGELLAAVGALPSGHLVETDRSGLVAAYVGQTALKVREVVEKAMGGVLFVDEAYSLARGGMNDFGAEALDALIKAMEDQRDKLVVILTGYTSEMQALFAVNPGLESRIAFTCEFPDYVPEELLQIAKLEAKKQGFILTPEAESALLAHFNQVDIGAAGNGRYARKLVEAAVRKAILVGRDGEIIAEDLLS